MRRSRNTGAFWANCLKKTRFAQQAVVQDLHRSMEDFCRSDRLSCRPRGSPANNHHEGRLAGRTHAAPLVRVTLDSEMVRPVLTVRILQSHAPLKSGSRRPKNLRVIVDLKSQGRALRVLSIAQINRKHILESQRVVVFRLPLNQLLEQCLYRFC